MSEITESFEYLAGDLGAPLLLCCEHASNRLPPPWRWPDEDRWLVDSHWAYDIGAAELTRELARATGAPALLARFSRLLIDPNRPPGHPTLIRRIAEGKPVALNAALTPDDRGRRLAYYEAYHQRLSDACRASRAPVLLALHSFTEEYEGQRRDDIEAGVLFDEAEQLAGRLAERLAALGLTVLLNQPYSGKQGMIYSADRHARDHGKAAVEIELRQDRIVDAELRRHVVAAIADTSWLRGSDGSI